MSNAGLRAPAGRPVTLRAMTGADIDAGLRLCRQSHWNQVARDWERFLRAEPGGATVAVDAATGQVIGSVATMRYSAAAAEGQPVPVTRDPAPVAPVAGSRSPVPVSRVPVPGSRFPVPESLAWIAMVLVDPTCRGSGIGTALLRRGLERVADATTVGLDATPLGQPLYEKLGFSVDTTLLRLQRSTGTPIGGRPTRPPWAVRPATPNDGEAIARLDAEATGLDRAAMLDWLREGAPGLAWVADGPSGLEGVLLGRHGHAASQLGPVIASSETVARDLVRTCLAARPGPGVFIDIAEARPGWRGALETLGFEAQRPFARMYRGSWRPRGDATRLFAVIGPEFG